MKGGEITYQRAHLEQMVLDNADVIIYGPGAINEDTMSTWTVQIPDCNLPADNETAWDVQWIGAASGSWTAIGGIPFAGSGGSFSSRFIQPGTFTVAVDASRDYSYKVHRMVPNPSYVEGEGDPTDAFMQVEVTMVGTISGSASKSGGVADITPPNMTIAIRTNQGDNIVGALEQPPNQTPAKTTHIGIKGMNFVPNQDLELVLEADGPATATLRVDSPPFGAEVDGFWVWEDVRCLMFVACVDNHSPSSALMPKWKIENLTKGSLLLPEGQSPFFLIRYDTEAASESILLTATVADEAGNTTTVEIPIHVLGRETRTDQLNLSSQRH